MRPRICMAIVTSKVDGTIIYRENKDQVEKGKRRAQFEINRKKLKCVIKSKNIDPQLISFNNNIANEIAKFKQSRNERN